MDAQAFFAFPTWDTLKDDSDIIPTLRIMGLVLLASLVRSSKNPPSGISSMLSPSRFPFFGHVFAVLGFIVFSALGTLPSGAPLGLLRVSAPMNPFIDEATYFAPAKPKYTATIASIVSSIVHYPLLVLEWGVADGVPVSDRASQEDRTISCDLSCQRRRWTLRFFLVLAFAAAAFTWHVVAASPSRGVAPVDKPEQPQLSLLQAQITRLEEALKAKMREIEQFTARTESDYDVMETKILELQAELGSLKESRHPVESSVECPDQAAVPDLAASNDMPPKDVYDSQPKEEAQAGQGTPSLRQAEKQPLGLSYGSSSEDESDTKSKARAMSPEPEAPEPAESAVHPEQWCGQSSTEAGEAETAPRLESFVPSPLSLPISQPQATHAGAVKSSAPSPPQTSTPPPPPSPAASSSIHFSFDNKSGMEDSKYSSSGWQPESREQLNARLAGVRDRREVAAKRKADEEERRWQEDEARRKARESRFGGLSGSQYSHDRGGRNARGRGSNRGGQRGKGR